MSPRFRAPHPCRHRNNRTHSLLRITSRLSRLPAAPSRLHILPAEGHERLPSGALGVHNAVLVLCSGEVVAPGVAKRQYLRAQLRPGFTEKEKRRAGLVQIDGGMAFAQSEAAWGLEALMTIWGKQRPLGGSSSTRLHVRTTSPGRKHAYISTLSISVRRTSCCRIIPENLLATALSGQVGADRRLRGAGESHAEADSARTSEEGGGTHLDPTQRMSTEARRGLTLATWGLGVGVEPAASTLRQRAAIGAKVAWARRPAPWQGRSSRAAAGPFAGPLEQPPKAASALKENGNFNTIADRVVRFFQFDEPDM